MLRQGVPVGPDRGKDVDHRRPFWIDGHLMVDARRDSPRSAWSKLADLVADGEGETPGYAHSELLVVVLVSRNDRIRRELDERQRDPLAVDTPPADGLAPEIDDRQRG